MENYKEQNTTMQNYDEADHTSVNTQHTLITTVVNFPREVNGLSTRYVQLVQGSTGFANSDMLPNDKNRSMESKTPQALWKKRCEANQRASLATNNSPSKYFSYKSRMPHSPSASANKSLATNNSPSKYVSLYKVRMPHSPSAFANKELKGSSDGRHAWLMNARKIRLEMPPSGPKSHLRSLSQCIERNKNDEFKEILRRPRRSLDSAAVQFQKSMCLSSQNAGFSFSGPYASCSSSESAVGGDISLTENISCFEVQPKFESYQLVGDSLFVRFAEQILDIPCGTVEGNRGIGLCVSGQKSGDLLRRVSQRMYPVSEKIVLLIGTNDVLQNMPKTEMCNTLERLLELLKMSVSKIVLLTLPPIPKLHLRREHREKIKFYNNFIRSLDDEVVSVADIHHLYVTENEECKMKMFERFYGDGPKIDLIHLNRSGLKEIQRFLLQHNFVN